MANNLAVRNLHTKTLEHHLNQVLDVKDSPIKFLEEGSSAGLKGSRVSVGSPGILEMRMESYVKDNEESPDSD